MESEISHIEIERAPRDISKEFLSMKAFNFLEFLRALRKEPALSIKVDWPGPDHAKRLKAFLEDMKAKSCGQKRTATIRATEDEYEQALNVFASGVKWERVEK